MQMDVKATFFQSEFRIRVGLDRRSWKSCQRMNETKSAPDKENMAIVEVSRTRPISPVMILHMGDELPYQKHRNGSK